MADYWRTNPMRPPPCRRCGVVESAYSSERHECNQVGLLSMRYGFDRAVAIGKSVVLFLTWRTDD